MSEDDRSVFQLIVRESHVTVNLEFEAIEFGVILHLVFHSDRPFSYHAPSLNAQTCGFAQTPRMLFLACRDDLAHSSLAD